jgi:DNA-binding NarL/FixJ family response regulator
MHRVIVVDDEPDFRQWLCRLLKGGDDFEVVGEVDSGEKAIRLMAELQPDLMIVDLYMPGMDGLEMTRYIQQHYPGVSVVLVSAQQERAYERLAEEEGALAFIPKLKLTLDAIRQVLP